jgi:hypothetical protein
MALRQGQREVRIEEKVVRQLVGTFHAGEKVVGARMEELPVPTVVFLVEKMDAEEAS